MPLIERKDFRSEFEAIMYLSNSRQSLWQREMVVGGTVDVEGRLANKKRRLSASSRSLRASAKLISSL
jgi:primosomal replication protein N